MFYYTLCRLCGGPGDFGESTCRWCGGMLSPGVSVRERAAIDGPVQLAMLHETMNSVGVRLDLAGGRMLTYGEDASLMLWDLQHGGQPGPIYGAAGAVAIRRSWDQLVFATHRPLGIQDIMLWDGEGRARKVDTAVGCRALAYSWDESHCAITDGGDFRLWRTDPWSRMDSVWSGRSVNAGAWVPGRRGQILLTTGDVMRTGSVGQVILVDAERRSESLVAECDEPCVAIAVSADGTRVAATSGRFRGGAGRLSLWYTDNGKQIFTVRDRSPVVVIPHQSVSVAGNRVVFCSDWGLSILDTDGGFEVASFERVSGDRWAVSPDGTVLAIARNPNKGVAFFNMLDGREIGRCMEGVQMIQSVAFSPDGSLLVVGDDDAGTVGATQYRIFTIWAFDPEYLPRGCAARPARVSLRSRKGAP